MQDEWRWFLIVLSVRILSTEPLLTVIIDFVKMKEGEKILLIYTEDGKVLHSASYLPNTGMLVVLKFRTETSRVEKYHMSLQNVSRIY
jgi:hypothetical protein